MTLVSDSQSLQFRLPPPGVAVPPPRVSAAIAGGTPVVDTLVLSSVWAVQVGYFCVLIRVSRLRFSWGLSRERGRSNGWPRVPPCAPCAP